MSDPDRLRIRQLDDKSDYALWRIRVKATIGAKGYNDAIDADGSKSATDDVKLHASNIIVSTLSDQALRVVRFDIGEPIGMLAKLDARFDSRSTATRIAKMSELVSARYSSLREDMAAHVDQMAALIEQLRAMGTTFEDALAVGILVASIHVVELAPVTASIKMLSEDRVTWDAVSLRLIEEAKLLSSSSSAAARPSFVKPELNSCAICKRAGHSVENCFLNPLGHKSKLELPAGVVSDILGTPGNRNGNIRNGHKPDKGRDKPAADEERAAMAHGKGAKSGRKADIMMLDSGTTSHLTPYADRVQSTTSSDLCFTLADNSKMRATHRGVRKVRMQNEHDVRAVSLSDTLLVPDAGMSLMSVPALVGKGIGVLFLPGFAVMFDLEDADRVLGFAQQNADGLYYVADDGSTPRPRPNSVDVGKYKAMMARLPEAFSPTGIAQGNGSPSLEKTAEVMSPATRASNTPPSFQLNSIVDTWHLRLGHSLAKPVVRRLMQSPALPHITCTKKDCDECTKGKFRRRFRGSITSASAVGTLHVDTKGQLETTSVNDHKYFVTITEEFSRFTAVRPFKSKADAAPAVLRFVKYFEKQSGQVVKKIHTDGGSEFCRALSSLSDQGVEISMTAAYKPESNGLVERAHQTITSNARTCLRQAKLPEKFWNFAVRHVVDCFNAVPNAHTSITPHVALFGFPAPYLHHLRPFGCRMLYRPVQAKLRTFAPRIEDGICLYHESGGVYNVLADGCVIRTKHVDARDSFFPGVPTTTPNSDSVAHADIEELEDTTLISSADIDETPAEDDVATLNQDALTYTPAQSSRHGVSDKSDDDDDEFHDTVAVDNVDPAPRQGAKRYSLRGVPRIDYSAAARESLFDSDTPKLSAAVNSVDRNKWLDAIAEEFDTITGNETRVECSPPPPGNEILPSGVILRIKRDEHGAVSRHKARLVVRGNFQNEVDDYAELYAPVASIEIVRLMLSLAVRFSYDIHQADVKGAFLHASLPESDDIYVRLPNIDGVPTANGQLVKLRKCLYGLRQSPKLWYKHLADTLHGIGFRRSANSDCLFIGGSRSAAVYIVAYVDDLLIFGARRSVDKVKTALCTVLTVTDLGACQHSLGISITRQPNGILLSQPVYSERILASANMADCKPTDTPLPLGHTLYREREAVSEEVRQEMSTVPYRQVLGQLIYLSTRTRPDIATAVSLLGKFQCDPTPADWKALKHLMRYICRTVRFGIFIPSTAVSKGLNAFSDADWARDESRRRSRTGAVIFYHDARVYWTSRLQQATALSTAEAEFSALSVCGKEVSWLRQVLCELSAEEPGPTTMHQDNLGCINWTESVQGLRNVKHVSIKYHYVRDLVSRSAINVVYVRSDENCADSLTKILGRSLHAVHLQLFGMSQ